MSQKEHRMNDEELQYLFENAVRIRRHLHEYPEIGFDLENTVDYVSKELERIGLDYTYDYGRGSVVADIGQGERAIALRADMDALPVEEKVDLPFKSKIEGKMHSCGHDSHTAILLAVAEYLKRHESELPCRVRLMFQPAEECAESGAKMMVDNGVLEGIDEVLCTHCETLIPTGTVGICESPECMAACVPVKLIFRGKTTHATTAEEGINAFAMGIDAHLALEKAVREEAERKGTRYIWSVGRFVSGHAHNVVPDTCEMDITFRYYDKEFAARVEARVREIANKIADSYGGKAEVIWEVSTGAVINSPEIVAKFIKAAKIEGYTSIPQEGKISSEDFGWYTDVVPGALFRFGIYNEAIGATVAAHGNKFILDEEGMRSAIRVFCSYAMNYEDL